MKLQHLIAVFCLSLSLIFVFAACGSSEVPETAEITEENVLGDFSSTDIDGNPVDKSVFADAKLTMVNIWGTFCAPCIEEMPDLADINREYADKGFQIVGLPMDLLGIDGALQDYKVEDAREIIETTGADYLHIMPNAELNAAKLSAVDAVPETIFVDSEGNQIGESYMGSRSKDSWTAIIDGLLEKMK